MCYVRGNFPNLNLSIQWLVLMIHTKHLIINWICLGFELLVLTKKCKTASVCKMVVSWDCILLVKILLRAALFICLYCKLSQWALREFLNGINKAPLHQKCFSSCLVEIKFVGWKKKTMSNNGAFIYHMNSCLNELMVRNRTLKVNQCFKAVLLTVVLWGWLAVIVGVLAWM